MREIKFRAILTQEARTRKEYGDWSKPVYFTLEDLMRGKVTFACPEHWHFSEWTGLKDRNDVEIYKGDIVMVGEIRFTIGWYAQSAAFWLISTTSSSSQTNISSAGVPARDWNWLDGGKAVNWHHSPKTVPVEVIGNIYEHPHLLANKEQQV